MAIVSNEILRELKRMNSLLQKQNRLLALVGVAAAEESDPTMQRRALQRLESFVRANKNKILDEEMEDDLSFR